MAARAVFDRTILRRAVRDSFVKLNPLQLAKNPVIFVVEVGAVVTTLLLARDLSALYYPFLEVREAHHAASYDNTSDGYERISRFHPSQLAYLAKKLDAIPEGEGTVLDNSCLMFLSNMWIGRKHDNTRLPLVLAGGMGGALETGRTLSYLDAGDDSRKLCSLYLSLMDRMGVMLDSFGDADTRLARL